MSKFQKILSNLGLAGIFLAVLFPGDDRFLQRWSVDWIVLVSGAILMMTGFAIVKSPAGKFLTLWCPGIVSFYAVWIILAELETSTEFRSGFWLLLLGAWLLAWLFIERLSAIVDTPGVVSLIRNIAIPVIFGLWLLLGWEVVVRGFGVPQVLLPPPSMIAERFAASTSILWADFKQTFLQAVLIGYFWVVAVDFWLP